NRFSDLYDFAPVGYVTISEKGIILQANLTSSIMLGVERSKLVEMPLSRFIHKDDQDKYYFHRNKLFKTNAKQTCELKIVRKDRTSFYGQLESIAVKDTKGDFVQILTAIAEISERKLSEEALKQSEEQLRIAVEGGKLGTWNRNLMTKEVVWKTYLYELLGRDPKGPAITWNTFFTYIHPDDIEQVRRHVDKTFINGTDFFDEFRVVREDEKVRWLAASGRVYRNQNGRPVRMAGVNYDITERKKAEEMVRQKQKRFRSFIELTEQFGLTADADGRVVEDLPLLSNYTGMSEEDLKGWGWMKAIHPDDRECAQKKWKEAIADKRKYEIEYRVRRYDGVYRYFLARGVPIFNDDGIVEEWVGICIDLSERKEVEKLLEKSHKDLESRVRKRTAELIIKKRELEDMNRDLLEEIDKRKKFETELRDQGEKILAAYRQRDILSKKLVDLLEKERHDIGNSLHDHIGQVLTGVKLELEGLKKALMVDESDLSDKVDDVQSLLKDAIIQARKISHNLRSDVLERFGLIPSIQELVEEMQKHTDLKIHLFIKNIPDDLKKDGIDLALYRLVQEALTNISKHAGAKDVFINLTRNDQYINLTVEDDGSGFEYDSIFNHKDSSKFSLGITIMRERVSMLGGEFRIDSSPGKGTHIQVQIPLNH
ncbi:MAG TPA: PAS domain-containing protein, partial [Desulfobacterales bacterium]|nr:PAS domain-containing protein [Desulfobacterales bacterium]